MSDKIEGELIRDGKSPESSPRGHSCVTAPSRHRQAIRCRGAFAAGSHSLIGAEISYLSQRQRKAQNTSGTWLLLLPVVLLLVSVLVAPLRAQTNEPTAKQFYSKIVRPVTLIDLLRNFKTAMDGDLLLRDDFYTDDNLKKFSGGERIIWIKVPPNGRGEIVGFGTMVKDLHHDGRTWGGLGIIFSQNFNEGREAVTGWLLTISDPNSVSFSEVEAIFGTGWEGRTFMNPPPHGPPRPPATHPRGYDRIVYNSVSPTLQREMIFSFSSDGKVGTANFILRRPIP